MLPHYLLSNHQHRKGIAISSKVDGGYAIFQVLLSTLRLDLKEFH
jgi:hypothetical protein